MKELNPKNIIFDLDGTLIDSFPGIAESLRHAVAKVNPSLELSALKTHIGPPLQKMLSRMWPDRREEEIDQVIHEFRADYNIRGCLFSIVYPGIPVILNRFKATGISLFVLTNKPQAPTQKILSHLGLQTYFTEILSPDSMVPSFSTKSEGALYLLKKHRLVVHETLLIGDSPDDLKAAKSAGFSFLEASYGYGNFDEIVTEDAWLRLKSPFDLAKLVNLSITP